MASTPGPKRDDKNAAGGRVTTQDQLAARAGHRRIATVPFTLRNLKEDLEDVGVGFDGAPDLEFRLAARR